MTSANRKIIIAIDGHSSCGKSTFARAIAEKTGYLYIDSGAMYRAVTLACMERGLLHGDGVDQGLLAETLGEVSISFRKEPGSSVPQTWMNGVNVEDRIRSTGVASNVSLVSKYSIVRNKLVSLQRAAGKDRGVVMEGRDIGTVVFPDAEIKIFMTAAPEIRAQRRYRELRGKGLEVDFAEVKENITERDRLDETRPESPLTRAPDAIILDNSDMTVQQQMDWFCDLLPGLNISLKCRT
jgi:CMP/dCMP kinase